MPKPRDIPLSSSPPSSPSHATSESDNPSPINTRATKSRSTKSKSKAPITSEDIARQILESHKALDRDLWATFEALEKAFTNEWIAGEHGDITFQRWATTRLPRPIIFGIFELHFAESHNDLPVRQKHLIERLQDILELSGLWHMHFVLGYKTLQSRETLEVLMRITRTWPELSTEELLNELHAVLHERIRSNARGQRKSLTSFQVTDAKAAEINIQKRLASQDGKTKPRQRSVLPAAQSSGSAAAIDGINQVQVHAGASVSISRNQAPENDQSESSHESSVEDYQHFTPTQSLSPKPLKGLLDPDTIANTSVASIELPRGNIRAVEDGPFEEDSMLQDRSYTNNLHQLQHAKLLSDDEDWTGEPDYGLMDHTDNDDEDDIMTSEARSPTREQHTNETATLLMDTPENGSPNITIDDKVMSREGNDTTFTLPPLKNVCIQRKRLPSSSKHSGRRDEDEYVDKEENDKDELVHEDSTYEDFVQKISVHRKLVQENPVQQKFANEKSANKESAHNATAPGNSPTEKSIDADNHTADIAKDRFREKFVDETPANADKVCEKPKHNSAEVNLHEENLSDTANPQFIPKILEARSPNKGGDGKFREGRATRSNLVFASSQNIIQATDILQTNEANAPWKVLNVQHPDIINQWETMIKNHHLLRDDLVNFLSCSDKCSPDILVLHPLYIKMVDAITYTTRTSKLLGYRLLVIPIYHPKDVHFSLVVVDVGARSMTHFDSLSNTLRFIQTKKQVLPWMASLFAEQSGPFLLSATSQKCFQQSDSISCGLIVAAWAKAVSENQEIPTSFNIEGLRADALTRLRKITVDDGAPMYLTTKTKSTVIDLESDHKEMKDRSEIAETVDKGTDNPNFGDATDLKSDTLQCTAADILDDIQSHVVQASILLAQYHANQGVQIVELRNTLQSSRQRQNAIQDKLPAVSSSLKRLLNEHYGTAIQGRIKRKKLNTMQEYFSSTLALRPEDIAYEDIAGVMDSQKAALETVKNECETLDCALDDLTRAVEDNQKLEEECKGEVDGLQIQIEHMKRKLGGLERQSELARAIEKPLGDAKEAISDLRACNKKKNNTSTTTCI
ncbi:hypothetical protein BKA64DRAFT_714383 [Cadophora sp. MPI-SDFR-AT-0126]|nr:hypothetical protein BKA64DRAFT_714383 [Leotiomycetes sp. MPI-SDFR-AT-0126]